MYEWIIPETGEVVFIRNTASYRRDMNQYYAVFSCSHDERALVRKRAADGHIQIREQCQTCGVSIGSAKKREPGHEALPLFNDSLEPQWREREKAYHEKIQRRHYEKQSQSEAQFGERYELYLSSPEWAEKRRKVMARANGLCEGCRDAPATEVHHLTYQNVFQEFLFELVAICGDCHERWHQLDEEAVVD